MNIPAEGIRPQILPEVEILSHRRLSLVVVTVFPGPRRPYYVQSLGRGRAWSHGAHGPDSSSSTPRSRAYRRDRTQQDGSDQDLPRYAELSPADSPGRPQPRVGVEHVDEAGSMLFGQQILTKAQVNRHGFLGGSQT
jgi:hypothetical protein